MKTDMINSRKLGVKAVITVEIHTEGETSQMAASEAFLLLYWLFTVKTLTVYGKIRSLQGEDQI